MYSNEMICLKGNIEPLHQRTTLSVMTNWVGPFFLGILLLAPGLLTSQTKMTAFSSSDLPDNKRSLDADEKEYYVGCVNGAMNGYFRPENWNVQSSESGNIPSMRLQKEGKLLVDVSPRQTVILSILLPASGHLELQWNYEGRGYCSLENGNGQPKGRFHSNHLHNNASFSITLSNTGSTPSTFSIDHLQFHTRALKVAVQKNQLGKPAYSRILENAVDFSHIIPPYDTEVSFQEDLKPEVCGHPMLDKDGHAGSKSDQVSLMPGFQGLQVSYQDEFVREGKQLVVYRTWVIKDPYKGNYLDHTQKITLRQTNPTLSKNVGNTAP